MLKYNALRVIFSFTLVLFSLIGVYALASVIMISMEQPTWDQLAKNQTDPQLITDYITQQINAHLGDPDAHMDTGASLDIHRTNYVIDHPALSVVDDKLNLTNFVLDIPLNDFTDWSFGGSGYGRPGFAHFATGATTNLFYWANMPNDDDTGWYPAQSHSPSFVIIATLSHSTSTEAYLGICDLSGDSAVGFKIVGTTLYAVWWDNTATEHLISLGTIAPTSRSKYEVRVYSSDRVEYWFNDSLLHTLSWPSDISISPNGSVFSIGIKKTTSTLRYLDVNKAIFQQAW